MTELALIIASERLEPRKRSMALAKIIKVPGVVLRAVDATIGWYRFGELAASCTRGWWHMRTVPIPHVALPIYKPAPFRDGDVKIGMTIRGFEVSDDWYRQLSGVDPFKNADIVWDWSDGKLHPQEAQPVFFHKTAPDGSGWERQRLALDGLSAYRTMKELHAERMFWWPRAQGALLRELKEAWFPIGTEDELASAGGMPPALFAAIVRWWEVRQALSQGGVLPTRGD